MTEPSRAVFLSYASQDAEAARRICEALQTAGIEVWFDQSELRGGDAWDAAIRRQIKTCALFIPIISQNTQARDEGYFRLEWKLAVDRSHLMSATRSFLVPVVVDDTADSDEHVPDRFRELQWTRLLQGETSAAFVERVAALLSGDPARAASHPEAPIAQVATEIGQAPAASAARAGRIPIWWWVVAGVIVLALGYLAVDKLAPSLHAPSAVTASVGKVSSSPNETLPVSANSIAVLPFTDMSEKKDQEYFSDGLAETLLDLLAKTPGLHVIARTSSFSFKGKSDDIPTIAAKLHVANILEGSVRRAGNHLRVTTQLIRAADGEHLWSETYDREMADVFKVQDDIAAAVVAALRLKLAPAQKTAAQRTSSPEAYSEYLLGNQFYNRVDNEGFRRAIEAYQKAITLDPHYAAAYAGLSASELMIAGDANDAAGLARAESAAGKSIELAPEEGTGYYARSFVRTLYTWDWAGARADAERAITLSPGEASNYVQYGLVLLALGRLPEATTALRKSVELDPLSTTGWTVLARAQFSARDFAGARDSIRHALEISPETPRALGYLGYVQLLEGQPAQALSTFGKIRDARWLSLCGGAMAHHALGHRTESQAALDELKAGFSTTAAYQIAEVYAWRGEKDLAFEWLDRAYAARDPGVSLLMLDPIVDSLRSDPRFTVLLHKLRLPQ
jgi:TolB-like protein/cytochrome c-type biogenesis protein CcmH/NrfG